MKKLFALLAGAGAILFFWRKKHHEEEAPSWSSGPAMPDAPAGEASDTSSETPS